MRLFNNEKLIEQTKFAISKVNYPIWKKMIFSFMGGLFIGMGYIGYLIIYFAGSSPVSSSDIIPVFKYLAASIFPAGILMCMFMGGNLFTSNALIFIGTLQKKIKWRLFLIDLLITWIFNAIGAISIAAIAFGANIFGHYEIEVANFALDYKVNVKWYNSLLSGIICNILVAGSIFAYNSSPNKGIGVFIVYIVIFLFAISGSQHVVANFFVISEGGFLSCSQGMPWSNEEIGRIFYNNLIPTTIGNMLGGMMIPLTYLIADSVKHPKIQTVVIIDEKEK